MRSSRRLVVSTMAMAVLVLGTGQARAGGLAAARPGSSGIEWQPAVSGVALSLTVSGPDGFYLHQQFAPSVSPTFSLFDASGDLRPAGNYAYELKAIPQLDEATRDELQGLRDQGKEVVRSALEKSGKLPTGPTVQSGYFSILDGAIEMGGRAEPATPGGRLAGKGGSLASKTTFTDSLCVGFDCPASPTFSDSSILMMENNTRIKFGDTSNSPFPNEDWEIEANSNLSGGQSYLGFNDCGSADNDGGCATDLVFAVEAGARQNALYVESDGDVGFGTSNPVVNLHVVDGNTPTLRLEQDGSSGFAAQTWDMAGNETNFFIRDVTGGSLLPFRIRPGAPSSSIDIAASGNVGIGTGSPSEALHVRRSSGSTNLKLETTASASVQLNMVNSGGEWQLIAGAGGALNYNRVGVAGNQFVFATNGNMTVQGTLTTGGPTCGGGCDLVLAPGYAIEPIEAHAAQMWAHSYLPAVGPTRPGAPMNLSEKTGGILNELEKAHIYIAQLNQRLGEKQSQLAELRQSNDELRKSQEALAEQVRELKALVDSIATGSGE